MMMQEVSLGKERGKDRRDTNCREMETEHILLQELKWSMSTNMTDLPSGFGGVSIVCSNLMFDMS